MIGKIISHYKILEKIGEGGMGIVYKAEDTKLKRLVALKFLPHHLTKNATEKERFYHEARAASALNHPSITTIYEIAEYEDQVFIAMELVEGKTLKQLADDKVLPLKGILDITIQICDGLTAAHDKGIIHRDIKSENIMVTPKGQVKIMDFGLAKLAGQIRLTKTGSTVGTAAYMSPEQICGQEIDGRSDIFSLGVVLYELLTGRLPFSGEYEAAVSYAILNETPATMHSMRPEVPPSLEKIVQHCLHKERGKRYQRSEELIDDLRRVQQECSALSKLPTKSAKVWWLAGAAMTALLLFGVLLFYPRTPLPSGDLKSIAVLPFKNLSDSKEDEYFSDGITEDILTQLSKISDLNVISRTTMMQYKNTQKSLREIGKELNVGVVLEGSVRHSGNRIRISSQLIDAGADKHLWAETYDREMKDVFAIQSDVAKQIAFALKTKLAPVEKERIERKQTENTEAYQIYLKGRFYWNKRTGPDLLKSIEYFNQAIEKDQSYALAYADLANAYVILPAFGFSSKENYPKAHQAATRALEFDSTLAEAHTVLAQIKENQYEWAKAEMQYRRAIELNKNYPTAHQWYSTLLARLGRFDEAIAEARQALELDPLSLIINYSLSWVLFSMRQYEQAKEQCDKGIELDPNFPWSYYVRGLVHEVQGDYVSALKDYQKLRLLAHDDPTMFGELGRLYARTDRKDDALKILGELHEYYKKGFSVCTAIANVYHGLGDKERTFEWLEKSIHDQEALLIEIPDNPLWDDLRSDPGFIALLNKMGLEK